MSLAPPSARNANDSGLQRLYRQDDFSRQTRDALRRLYDPVYLQTHALTHLAAPEGRSPPGSAGAVLRRQLADAVHALQPSHADAPDTHAWRGYRLLTLRYVEALPIRDVQAKLVISKSEYFRVQRAALQALVSLLAQRWGLADGGPVRNRLGRRAQVVLPLTRFIGRGGELVEVERLLTSTRLLTLIGPGGIGKTRLALEVATRLPVGGGAVVVELAAVRDPGLTAQTIADALGVETRRGEPVLTALGMALRDRQLLLVLDNCEHLLDPCARVATALLQACPRLRILATGREALRVAGEVILRVPPLAVPAPGDPPTEAALGRVAAVCLYLDRAAAALPGFTLTAQNAPAIARLCRQLDGLPLAIELAAARVRVLTAEQLVERLADRFGLLTSGDRTAPYRQQSLRATVDWSYELLSGPERALFYRLSVFPSDWGLEAAEAVTTGGDQDSSTVSALLARLVDQSLVQVEERAGEARYRLLETLHRYGQERLREAGEDEQAHHRLRDWALRLAERAWEEKAGAHQVAWWDRLELELDSLRAVLAWCHDWDPSAGLQLASRLYSFWEIRGYRQEGRRWLEALLAQTSERTMTRARALVGVSIHAYYQGDLQPARRYLEESLALARALGDPWSLGMTLHQLGHLAQDLDGDAARARDLMEDGLHSLESIDDTYGVSSVLRCLGHLALRQGDRARAKALCERNVALTRQRNNRWQLGLALADLGQLARLEGDQEEARALLVEGLAHTREAGHPRMVAWSLLMLAAVLRTQGEYAEARALLEESLQLLRSIGDPPLIGAALGDLGDLARLQGDHGTARALLEEGLALRRALGDYRGSAAMLRSLGRLAMAEGSPERAKARFEESVAASRDAGDTHHAGLVIGDLGTLARRQGNCALAQERWLACLETVRDCGHPWCASWALSQVGVLTFHNGAYAAGARLISAAAQLQRQFWSWLEPDERAECRAALAAAQAALGEEAPTAVWSVGRALPHQAIDDARTVLRTGQVRPSRAPGLLAGATGSALTRRERDVAVLIARGRTDRQIAVELAIAEGTVGAHTEHLYRKLGMHTRAQVATWVQQCGWLAAPQS